MSNVVPSTEPVVSEEPKILTEVQPTGNANRWVRLGLVVVSLLITTVFIVATFVRPYEYDRTTKEYVLDEQGNKIPLRMGSHTSIGLDPCRFKEMFNLPCPSCGMTTSFATVVRGDLSNSVKANWVGTLLAAVSAFVALWGIASAFRGRLLGVTTIEIPLGFLVGTMATLMLIRWGIVLVGAFWE